MQLVIQPVKKLEFVAISTSHNSCPVIKLNFIDHVMPTQTVIIDTTILRYTHIKHKLNLLNKLLLLLLNDTQNGT